MTQAELARAVGISQSAIASYESRQRLCSRSTFKLASVLKVDPLWLQTGRGSMTPCVPIPLDLALDENLIREGLPEYWPFPSIRPSLFDALTSQHRRLLERAALGFINCCLEEYADAQMQSRHEQTARGAIGNAEDA